MNILHVCANPKPTEESASKQMAAAFFASLVNQCPDFEVTNIDLYQTPPPYLSYEEYRALWYPVFVKDYKVTNAEQKTTNYAKEHGALVNNADLLVITTPMWNYSLPAILKAWIDQVITPGIMFTIDANGVKPLHKIKQIILLAASGGVYKEEDPRDCLSAQIKAAFGFVGIEDISIAWADGQNPFFFQDSQVRKEAAIEAAQELAEDIASEIQNTAPESAD